MYKTVSFFGFSRMLHYYFKEVGKMEVESEPYFNK